MSQDGSTTGNPEHHDALQFDVAEPARRAAGDAATSASAASLACQRCRRAITTSYYEVQRAVVCASCRGELERGPVGSGSGRGLRALGLGSLAAVAGSLVYYAIAAATGYELAIVAIAVAYGIGKAVRRGSGGRGGRKYQWLAVGLTYLAIVSTYIPPLVRQIRDEAHSRSVATDSVKQAGVPRRNVASAGTAAEPTAVVVRVPSDTAAPAQSSPVLAATAGRASAVTLLLGVLALLAMAIVLPFLAGASNLIGLVIIGVALWQAWKLNRRIVLQFTGPYQVGAARTSGPAA